jgi:hypothetical protein
MSRVRDLASILTASSSMATDTEVSAVSAQIPANVAGKNFVINGGMDIAQRGTSLTGVNGYSLDRWLVNGFGTNSNISVGQYLISTLIPGLRYYMRVAPTTSNTQNFWISQSLETHEVIRLASKQVTLSFYHRMPFAFTGTWSAAVSFSTGTDANLHYPAASTTIFAENLSGTAAWQRYTKTFTVPANATSLAIQLQSTNNVLSTAMFDLTGVQLEIGSVATDFSRAGGDIQGELAKCQRYYSTSIATGFTITDFSGMNQGSSSAVAWCSPGSTNDAFTNIQYPVPMRSAPTFNIYSAGNRTSGSMRDNVTGSDITVSNYTIQAGNNKGFNYMSGMSATSGRPYGFQWTASAEL